MFISLVIFGIPYSLYRTCKLLKQNVIEVQDMRLLLKYWTVYSLLLSITYIFEFLINWIPLNREFVSVFIILLQSKDRLYVRLFDLYIQGNFDNYEAQIDNLKSNAFNHIKSLFSLLSSLLFELAMSKIKTD